MLKIASVGDICVDIYPKENRFILGGTAFNRAKWLAQNGVAVSLISAVGTDDWGKKYLTECRRLNINTDYLTIVPGLTSHVEITLDANHSPQFSEWNLEVLKNFRPKNWPENQDALITTGLKPIKQLLKLPASSFQAADFDGNTPYAFTNTEINKFAAAYNLVIAGRTLKISHPFVLITLGSQGSQVVYQGQKFFCPTPKIKTKNTTGAGDVYISAFILKYLKTKNIPLSMKLAARAAAKFISQPNH